MKLSNKDEAKKQRLSTLIDKYADELQTANEVSLIGSDFQDLEKALRDQRGPIADTLRDIVFNTSRAIDDVLKFLDKVGG